MAGTGGRRPGAGRKPKAEKYARPINDAEQKIADHLPLIVDALLRLAQGVYVEDYNPITDRKVVYQKPPDRAAAEYLMDRLMGKPTQVQDIAMQSEVAHKVYERSNDFDPDDA